MRGDLMTLVAINNFIISWFIPIALLALVLLIYGSLKNKELMVARAKAMIHSVLAVEFIVYAFMLPAICELIRMVF